MGAIQCKECGAILISRSRHDFVQCRCDQNSFVDGGDDYMRTGGKNMDKVQVLHPILLVPVDKTGTYDLTGIPNGKELLEVVNNAMLLERKFPFFPDASTPPKFYRDEESGLTEFKEDTQAVVNGLRAGLRGLREVRYLELLEKQKQAAEPAPTAMPPVAPPAKIRKKREAFVPSEGTGL